MSLYSAKTSVYHSLGSFVVQHVSIVKKIKTVAGI